MLNYERDLAVVAAPPAPAWVDRAAHQASRSPLLLAAVVSVIPGGVLLGARLGMGFAAFTPALTALVAPSESRVQYALLAALVGGVFGAVWGFVLGMVLAAALAPLVVLGFRLRLLLPVTVVVLTAAGALSFVAIPDAMLALWFGLAVVHASGGVVAVDWLSRRISW